MNFFEHQDAARKRTGRLVALFILGVAGVFVATYLVVAGVVLWMQSRGDDGEVALRSLLDWRLLAGVGAAVFFIIGGGSLFKVAQLRSGGGSYVARHLGGRLLDRNTNDPLERRILNVVDEMAIASGTPSPPVFFMDREEGINAFAAGYSPKDAVIGVTRGCAEQLSRDELQGVMAHEFSHIFNGDMRLNIRLIGLLNGILIVGAIGYFILRSAVYTGGARRRSSDDKGGGVIAILALGAGLALIGAIGTFFGSLIKAAVSRQREFLADASAVQFTRNPDGIADALSRIGGLSKRARIDNPNAPEASHMFFGQAVTSGFAGMFATHPPLPQRIKRITPSWDGTFLPPRRTP
ncbi:MAG: M48 family metallopeptidase, partial [Planctomycetota bacterium]|nr:M48 family metallopeptidase [Planctomycetota bacterium]